MNETKIKKSFYKIIYEEILKIPLKGAMDYGTKRQKYRKNY